MVLVLAIATPAFAQTQAPVTLNAVTAIGPTPPINLRGTGVTSVFFTWSTFGTVSAGACALEGGADGVTFGTTVIAAQTVTASGSYLTLTSTTANYLHINCTTPIVGSGSVLFRVFGLTAAGSVVTVTSSALPTGAATENTLSAMNAKIAAATDPCFGVLKVTEGSGDTAATALVIATHASGKMKHVCGGVLTVSAATNVFLVRGHGTKCGTGTAYLGGISGKGIPMKNTTGGGFLIPQLDSTVNDDDICVFTSDAVDIGASTASVDQ